MRWWTIWGMSALLLLHMTGYSSCAKDHLNKDANTDEHKAEMMIPRFTIPHPNHPESAFIPEAIGQAVGNERGTIVGTELPGAYGEDYDMEGGFESGSGAVSGSGSGKGEKDSESPEAPGKYGTNMEHSNNPPSNPSAAFVGIVNDDEEEKEDVDLGKELDADDPPKEEKEEKEEKVEKEEKEEKKEDEPSQLPEASVKVETKKETKEEKVEAPKKAEKHHNKAEKSSKVAKKKTKTKSKIKSHDENNMISKIDAIAKQIERVEHREKLDRKEAATLKVAKKVAKKVIKNINAKKKHKKTHKISHKSSSNLVSQALSQALSHKSFDEFSEDEDKPLIIPTSHKKERASVRKEEPKALEISPVRAPPVDATVDPNFKYWMEALRKESNPPPAPKIDMHEAVFCSTSHPYAFHNGSHCCATQEDNEGGKLTIHSTTCKGMKVEECASVTCKDNDLSIGPEGFECPWACFWTCHSYCPKECCNNPFKCDLGCREFCTPYCTDRCCAPGSQRLPKLQINFNSDDERKNISAIFAEDDRHQLLSNASVPASASPHEKEEEDAKLHTRLDPAENSYQQLKEQEHQIALANQIEALKKATSYAAQLMGLPPECPLACARICLPGLCKQQCCARSQIPNVPIAPPAAFQGSTTPMGNFNPSVPIPNAERAPIVSGPQVNPSRNQLALANQFAMAQRQRYLMTHNQAAAAASALQQRNANAYMMNKLALQNRLLEGKNDFVPALARYRAMQYASQMNRQKMLLKNSLESQASRQQIADASQRCEAGYPCQQQHASSSSSSPSWLHNCPPICRSSCIPQCPNECCAHSTRGAPSMK